MVTFGFRERDAALGAFFFGNHDSEHACRSYTRDASRGQYPAFVRTALTVG